MYFNKLDNTGNKILSSTENILNNLEVALRGNRLHSFSGKVNNNKVST